LLLVAPLGAAEPDAIQSADAVRALALGKVTDIPLTKADASKARELLWTAHVAKLKAERAEEMEVGKLVEGKAEMPYSVKVFGKKPDNGYSLWLSLHGGGGAPARVNDQQWENQKKLYTLDEGIYIAPRAPTNTWNLWHEPHIDKLFARMIENYVAVKGVNPDRVYVIGYSAGGDGVYQIAPRMADSWAAAGMMAGHPNDASPLSLRNVAFALQVGGNDSAYNRNKVVTQWGQKLFELERNDLRGYTHFYKLHEGKPHWMSGEDKIALPWMAKHTRNPVADRVVWKQSSTTHDRSYWLAVPPGTAKGGSLVVASRSGQTVTVTEAEGVTKLIIRFDDRMQNLDEPVSVVWKGKELFRGTVNRTTAALQKTLADRGDPKLMFDAEVEAELK
jgi:poly(3-hydroxybutyrate) depolymerase